MTQPLLKALNISKSFSGSPVLENVSLTVHPGEVHCLIGENGCGKSTLIKVISGVLVPDSGRIEIGGKEFKQLRPIEAIRAGIQVIYQDFSLFPNLSVAENIALNGQLARGRRWVSWSTIRKTAQSVIDQIGASIDINAPVENLSVADKQIVAICRALAQNAQLIIMDEPTTALTEREVRSLFKLTKQLQSRGISFIFVSHKLHEVFEICDRITVLRNGREVANGEVSSFTHDSLVEHMTGRKLTDNRPGDLVTGDLTQSLLKVEGLSLRGAFADISFELFAGEIIGITGLLGSGRTELALSLFGMQPATSGDIFIDDKPVKIRSVEDAVKHRIAYVPEDRLTEGLFLTQSIAKNISVSTVRQRRNRVGLIRQGIIKNQSIEWVNKLRIVCHSPEYPVNTLSGGNQQRVVLAKWLARQPRILVLNGPTVGVDVGSKADIHEILRNLSAEGVGIIVISDDIPELLQNCHRVLVMRKGRLVDEFFSKDVTENELAQKLSGESKGVTSQ